MLLDKSGKLYWATEIDGKKKFYDKAPRTAMQRFLAGFIRILPVEGQL